MGIEIELVESSGKIAGSLWLGESDRSYILAGGRRCMMPQTAAWCRDCGDYVAAESVPSLQEIERELESSKDNDSATRWRLVKEWRLLRNSPPKCLACFSSNVDLIPSGFTETTHPVTGKLLHVGSVAFVDMAYHWEYSIEGDPVEVALW